MHKGSIEWACLCFIGSISFALAEPLPSIDETLLPPQAQLINGVLIPVPSEIFRVLDTFRDSNWKAVLRPDFSTRRPTESTAKTALSLGLVLGEGFVAIVAEDATEMQDLGKTAIKLARALGVEKSVLRREKSIMDHIDRKDWAAVRREWSEVSTDLKAAMIEIKSEPLSQLVSLGGWLRGLEALAVLTSKHYTVRNAQLLCQPAMLDYFADLLGKMENKFQEDTAMIAIKKIIIQLRPLMVGKQGSAPSESDVRRIREISTNSVNFLGTE